MKGLLAASLLLASCATIPRVEVTRLAEADAWRVRYRLPEPSTEVRFARPGHTFRGPTWRVSPPSSWRIDDQHEILTFAAPQRSFTVEFPSDFIRRDKGYDFVVPFSDGARLLYTGSLSIAPRHRWQFLTEREERIVLLDHEAAHALEWAPHNEPEDGTYVYFGNQRPVRGRRMSAIVDAGLPDWIEGGIATILPRQFDFFAQQLQTELAFRPVVFISWGGPEGRGRTFKGGTLEGLMAVSLSGAQWVTETPDAKRGWFHHLAHESFHFWDGEMFEPMPKDAEWLSESAAEYMALVATRAEGLIDDAGFRTAIADYAKRCDRFSKSDSRSFYTCGVVIQARADEATGGRIVEVYRETFVQHYTTERFLDALRRLARDPAAIDGLLH